MEYQTSEKKEVHLSIKHADCKEGMTGQYHISPMEEKEMVK